MGGVACGAPGETTADPGQAPIEGTPQCAGCQVLLTPLVLLKGTSAFPFDERSVPGRDGRGKWFATATGGTHILRYDPDGTPDGGFGSAGDGPGELRPVEFLVGFDSGVVAVQSGRATWFGEDGAVMGQRPGRLACQQPIDGDRLLCVGRSAVDGDSSLAGPLLILDRTRGIIERFGTPPSGDAACPTCESYLALEPGDHTVWTVSARDYQVARSARGGLTTPLGRVTTDWFDTPRPGGDPRHPRPSGRIWGVHLFGHDTLLVIASAPDGTASTHGDTATPRPPGMQTFDAMTAGYGTVLELVDPSSGVLVSTRFPGRRLMPVGEKLIYEARYDDSGQVVIQIYDVEVDDGHH